MFIENIIVQGYTATDPPNHRRSNPLGSEKNLTPKTPIYVRNAAN